MIKYIKNKKNGFSLVEVLIASAMISLVAFSLVTATTKGLELSDRSLNQIKVNNIIEEGIEAVKTIRDTNWDNIENLGIDTDYYLSFNTGSNSWQLVEVNQDEFVNEIFNRKISFHDIERDENTDDIVASGTLDDGGRRVDISITYLYKEQTINKEASFYLFNLFD
jgi:prepilin-type N-terminal cleavage/methylation domain-containing protein